MWAILCTGLLEVYYWKLFPLQESVEQGVCTRHESILLSALSGHDTDQNVLKNTYVLIYIPAQMKFI